MLFSHVLLSYERYSFKFNGQQSKEIITTQQNQGIGITGVKGSNSVQDWSHFFFSGLIFTNALRVFITAQIAFVVTSLPDFYINHRA